MLYSCAAFGSMTVGSDIDIRMMRGKDSKLSPPPSLLLLSASFR